MGKSHARYLCVRVIRCQNDGQACFNLKPLRTNVSRGDNWMIWSNHRSELEMVKSKNSLC